MPKSLNIGIIIGRIGDVDGVALETEKWITVLKEMGHEIFILSGRYKHNIVKKENETLCPALSFFSPECEWEQNRAFYFPEYDPDELLKHLDTTSDRIAVEIFKWTLKNDIDVILAENNTALPSHLSMGIGIKKVINKSGIPLIAHEHDYLWERGDRYKTPHKELEEIITNTFPLIGKNVKHAVINLHSQKQLKKRFNSDSIIVPNVMDFNKPYAVKDDYNRNLKSSFGFKEEDVLMFQITRIVERKGIEVAIELVKKLDDERIKLIITGSAADDARKGYYKQLVDYINKNHLKEQIIFGHHTILNNRGITFDNKNVYSLSDAYANAVATTYFSTYEGFGNAFVESVLAKTPIFVNNYKPVYWPDIGSKGFKTVQLEDNILTDHAVKDMKRILFDTEEQKEIADFNFKLGKKYFSYDILREKLEELFGDL